MTRVLSILLASIFVTLISGCSLFRTMDVESVDHSVDKPSNVAVYLTVSEGNEPVTDLTEQNFAVFENEQAISPDVSKLVVLNRDLAASHHTLLLVDMSAAKDEGTRQQLSRAVAGFVAFVRRDQPVTVYAFDGSADIKLIGDYEKGQTGPESIAEIANFKNPDASRNLHGAVIAGIKELGARLMTKKPIQIGTVVTLTAGPDLAGRANEEQMLSAVRGSRYQVIAVGIGEEKAYNLLPIGKHGVFWAPSLGATGPELENAASRVQSMHERHYLISYCSPARAGKRRLRVDVMHTSTDGQDHKGSVNVDFDATGFGPGCDPSKPPSFGQPGFAAEAQTKPETPAPTDKPEPEQNPETLPPSGPPAEPQHK